MSRSAAVRQLAEATGTDPDDWYLVFKARYGMQVVLDVLADVRGRGDVATQIFTCSTAVDPILVAGMRPAYAEVSPDSVAIDPERLVVGSTTRAVVLQHTFGIVDTARSIALRDRADAAGALLLEDSAHCVGRMARGADGEPLADVSVHSFGVEKMLPTRFGGAVWINPRLSDARLRDAIRGRLDGLPVAGRRLDVAARTYRNQIRVLNRLPRRVSSPLRSTLARLGVFEPAVAPVEQRGGLPYAPMGPTAWMTDRMASALRGLRADEARRAGAVARYLDDLGALGGVVHVPAAVAPDSALVRFPFFAADRAAAERVIAAVRAAGYYPGDWYRPALFPATDPGPYGYVPGQGDLAVTEDLIERVVNLPTSGGAELAGRVAAVVRDAL